jgi:hypothetical protein
MRSVIAVALTTLVLPLAAVPAAAQETISVASRQRVAPVPAAPVVGLASAIRAERAPVLDGRGDDAVWLAAPQITDFRIYDPDEGKVPPQPTTAQVAYDERNLYVLVRAHDVSRDSVVALLSRRDERTPSDWIRIMVDSYHDKRTGYQFIVNPAGVKRDIYIFNDGDEDVSWDAVWHVQTRIDSAGWTAEFAIPWSQLRYPNAPEHTIGLMVIREVGRRNERQSWPLFSRQKTGFVSQFGDVSGIRGLPNNRRLEVMPYVVNKAYNQPRARDGDGYAHKGNVTAGADVKYGLTPNLTIDATINPDFGQVEADPAAYNLGTTELFFTERRPFFMEGMGIFRFDLNCNDGECTGLFYSRRVGQAPLLGGDFGDETTPSSTTILGAGKLTGRLNNGLSVGVLNAVTQRELGAPITRVALNAVGDTVRGNDGNPEYEPTSDLYVVQPMTSYTVARAQQELRGGNTVFGVMGTAVNRRLQDDATEANLRREGYSGGLDFKHRFAKNTWALGGYFAGSLVRGSADAIALTQRSNVHRYDRVGAELDYDPTRTSLAGTTSQLSIEKISGRTRSFHACQRTTPGFEINDAGYLGRADTQSCSNWVGLRFNKPRAFYRMVGLNFNQWSEFNTAGERLGMGGNINGHSQLKSNWFVYGGTGINQLASYNDRAARGGPSFRRSPAMNNWAGFETDSRKKIFGFVNFDHFRGDYGRSRFYGIGPGTVVRPSTRYSITLQPRYSRSIDDSQWYDNIESDGITHYTFGHLDQKTVSLTSRVDFSATPTLSMQLYASPFITAGSFSDLRELSADPRSKDYDTRYTPYTLRDDAGLPRDPGGFNYKQFNSNAVMRWEYRPGSALFLVWSQGRVQDGLNPGSFDIDRDRRDLFRAHPRNTFLIKGSYWLSL